MSIQNTPKEPDWVAQARQTRKDRSWLRKSAAISIRILFRLKEQGRSQRDLAETMRITPQQVNKFVKGHENLTLETICKLESALGISLIEIPGFEGITFHVAPKAEPVNIEWTPFYNVAEQKLFQVQPQAPVYDSSNMHNQKSAA